MGPRIYLDRDSFSEQLMTDLTHSGPIHSHALSTATVVPSMV